MTMKQLNLEDILKANPHIDSARIAEISRLLASVRDAGVPCNTYGINKKRPSTLGMSPADRREAVRLGR